MASTTKSLLRGLYRELRHSMPTAGSADGKQRIMGSPAAEYIGAQMRRFQLTERQHCRAVGELRHLADTYRTYLASQRLYQQVHEEFHAKGERSVEDTAKVVGFKLPHDPK